MRINISKICLLNGKYLGVFLVLLFLFSCGINDLKEIEDVKIKANPKIVLPLAFGSIDLNTLASYLSPNSDYDFFDEDGYLPFDNIFTEIDFSDTIAFNGLLLEKIKEAELRVETNNHLPLGIDIRLIFTSTADFATLGDIITCPILKPASINDEGKVTSTTNHVEDLTLTESQLSKYSNADAIIVLYRIYVPDSESQTIYLHRDDFLSLNVGLAVQINTGEKQP